MWNGLKSWIGELEGPPLPSFKNRETEARGGVKELRRKIRLRVEVMGKTICMVSSWMRASNRFIGEISWKKNTGRQRDGYGWRENRPGFQLPHVFQTEPTRWLLMASMSVVSMPSAVPSWALATIVLVSALLVFSCCFCLYRKRCRRRMGKKSQAQAQVHLQEVKELGLSYIDKVWPIPTPQPFLYLCSSL